VAPAMRSFVEQPGVPLVRAELRCGAGQPQVGLRQSRQLPLGSPGVKDSRWEVPVCIRTSATQGHPDCRLLKSEEATLTLSSKTCPSWIALNPHAGGYYRWSLPADQLQALLRRGYSSLRPAERLSLASNLGAAFRSGALSAADVLAALGPFARDPEPAVAQEPAAFLKVIHEKVVPPAQRPRVEAYMRSLYAPVLSRIGWKGRPGEPARVQIFRPWLVHLLAFEARDSAVLARASALGRAYLGADGHLHPEAVDKNLVPVALRAAGRLGSTELFETMLQRLWAAEDSNVREALLQGLSQFTDPRLSERARGLAFDDRIRVNERTNVLADQIPDLDLRPAAWGWVKSHVSDFPPRIPASYVQFLAYSQSGCSEADAQELERVLGPALEPYPGARYTVGKALERTRLCEALVAHHRASAFQFFERGGAGRQATTLQ
jgi:alanyl aminopeptidase